MACSMPNSMPLWTSFTKWPEPGPPAWIKLAFDRERFQQRKDKGDGRGLAAHHEAGAVAGAAWAARGAEVDEMQPLLFQPLMAADGIAPVGIAAVDEDVAGFADLGEIREARIHGGTCGDVEEDDAGFRQQADKRTDVLSAQQTRLKQPFGNLSEREACDLTSRDPGPGALAIRN